MNKRKYFFVSCFLLITMANLNSQNILFLGNSIFSCKDVPEKLEEFCRQDSLNFKITDACKDGYLLSNHLKDSTSIKIVQSQSWDYIVVTGFDTSMEAGGTGQLSEYIDTSITRIVLVQPISEYIPKKFRKRQLAKFRTMMDAFASHLKNPIIVNAGEYVDCHLDAKPDELFFEDGVHPNDLGATVMAYGIYRKLFKTPKKKTNIHYINKGCCSKF